MKRIALFLTALFLFTSCELFNDLSEAEPKDLRVTDILIKTNGTNYRFSVFTYTGNKVTQIMEHDWDGSAWYESYRMTATYSGNSVTLVWERKSGTSWSLQEKFEYTFSGEQVSEEIRYVYSGGWDPVEKNEYEYFSGGIMRWHSYDQGSNGWYETSYGVYTYEQGLMTEYNRYSYDGFDFFVSRVEQFSYNGDQLEGYVRQVKQGTTFINSKKYEYEYSGGVLSELDYFDWSVASNDWSSAGTTTYHYNSYGDVIWISTTSGTRNEFNYEDGIGNAKFIYYRPDALAYQLPTLRNGGESHYVPMYARIY